MNATNQCAHRRASVRHFSANPINAFTARRQSRILASADRHRRLLFSETSTSDILKSLKKLINVLKLLRNPYIGCKWDLKQDTDSLKNAIIEEAFEAVQAIEDKNNLAIQEELGDLLFVILMHIQIAEQNKLLDAATAINGISDKLIRRHPHIFGDIAISSTDDILRNWENIKRSEKRDKKTSRVLQDIPRGMPALSRIQRVFSKLARLNELTETQTSALKQLKDKCHFLFTNFDKISDIRAASGFVEIIYFIALVAHFKNINLEDDLQRYIAELINRYAESEL